MKSARHHLRLTAVLIPFWLLLCLAIGIVAGEWALHPWRRPLTPEDKALALIIAQRNRASLSDISIVAADGVQLRGWSMRPIAANGNAVILLHGVGDNRMGMLGYADLLLSRGYAILLPDARAHGESGGELATYGVKESGDVRRWYDWIERTEFPRCIDGLGNSMGAALLLESLRTTPGFARWWRSPRLRISGKHLMTAWVSGAARDHGSGALCCVLPSNLACLKRVGCIGLIWCKTLRKTPWLPAAFLFC
jgi:pimeloyl-ACP methyl ester carboxylesterase